MRTAWLLAFSALVTTGCGGIGFEVGDADREEKEKAEHLMITMPNEALRVGEPDQEVQINGIGADDAAGVIGSFTYQTDVEHEIHLAIVNVLKNDCPDSGSVAPEFLWRELDKDGATVAEEDVNTHDFFDAKAGVPYLLVVTIESKLGRCKNVGVAFSAKRYVR